MILCSCTVLDRRSLERAVTEILREDPQAVITPGRLFHRCDRRMGCARCAPLIQAHIARALAAHGRETPD